MKRNNKKAALSLSTETLRTLDDVDNVVGGQAGVTSFALCPTHLVGVCSCNDACATTRTTR